ncbi:S8 family peptidase [Ascidiimonas aurantiaca]|uniref:S8 family peptidase n=1 Tax=Ascidiimonas aurantiaca TaxID=1685432 RepID=UPI0030EB8103
MKESIQAVDKDTMGKGFYLIQTQHIQEVCSQNAFTLIKKLEDNFNIIHSSKPPVFVSKVSEIYALNNLWKISKGLKKKKEKLRFSSENMRISIAVMDPDDFESELPALSSKAQILSSYQTYYQLEIPVKELDSFVNHPQVVFIDITHTPSTEAPVNENDISVNTINTVHNRFPALDGRGMTVSVKELAFDSTDIDFKDRFFFTGLQAEETDSHASAMSTVIGGAGNSSYKGRGVANAVRLTSSSFINLLPDPDVSFTDNDISVQNHSYGTTVESQYGNEAAAYDTQIRTVGSLLHIFSSGNSGTSIPETGPYAGIEGFANLTGNFKMGKNVITVGAMNTSGEIDARSSKGPAYDGRVKPELVSFAPGGTSDASALVSGSVVLLQQQYREQKGQLPSSSLIKAVLIAGADDVGPPAVDFTSGYGSLNALQSVQVIEQETYIENTVSQGETLRFSITIPNNTSRLRVALSWNDPAARPGDVTALVNDLDMQITDAASTIWLPWVLNSYPSVDSITQVATRKKDHLNNNELITIANPVPGIFTIELTGSTVSTGSQPFSIAYFMEEENRFEWTFPTSTDAMNNQAENKVRWNNTFQGTTGTLEININNSGWQEIENNIPLNNELQRISLDGIAGFAQLRMQIDGNSYLSDVFGISSEIVPEVLFDCEEETAFAWNAIEGATAYTIKNLGNRYMETIETVTDTVFTYNKATYTNPHFSIAPVFTNTSGLQGRTINRELFSINCYYVNFFAFIADDSFVRSTLNLSTRLNVSQVVFEKVQGDEITVLDTFLPPFDTLLLNADDTLNDKGLFSYRAVITLSNGTTIVTEAVEIRIPGSNTLILFPNPISAGSNLNIISAGNEQRFQIVDLSGRILKEGEINFIQDAVNVELLPGIYIFRVIKDNETITAKKFIVN